MNMRCTFVLLVVMTVSISTLVTRRGAPSR